MEKKKQRENDKYKVHINRFLDWWFKEVLTPSQLGEKIAEKLNKSHDLGIKSITINPQNLFDCCEFIPDYICTFTENKGRKFKPSDCILYY